MRKEQETFTALGIEEDRIIFTGSTEKETLKGYDRYVDLEGMHVFPTLTDSHVHLLYTMILAASSFNLCEVTAGGNCAGQHGRSGRQGQGLLPFSSQTENHCGKSVYSFRHEGKETSRPS